MRNKARSFALAFAAICCAESGWGQTAVVQNPGGGTSVVSVQSDGSGRTTVVMQAGGDQAAPALPAGGAVQGGAIQLQIGGGGTPGVPLPFSPRDASLPLPTGTSTLRGRVTAADSGRPLRRAVVRVATPSAREARTVTTDQNGRWEMKDIPAGSYNISANRPGFVAAGYKQPRMMVPPRPVTVADRETRENLDIVLTPGGVLTGRVVDEFGEPVSDTMVTAQRLQYTAGERRPVMSGPPASSNDIGEFRIYGLQPGSYYLSASPRGLTNPFDTPADRMGYGQTWFPAATDLASAQRIVVRAGETVSGLVVALAPARTARITGTVLGADGLPARGGVVIVSGSASPVFVGANGMIRPDGTFTLNAVAPGDYTLRATTPGVGSSFSTASISVNGTDIDGVVLQPQTPTTVTGRLVGDPATLAAIDPSRVRLMAAPVGLQVMAGPPQPPQPVSSDLTFSLQVSPGTFSVRPLSLPGLIIRAVRMEGIDVTRGFSIATGGAATELEVEVVASTARLIVTAMNGRGEAAAGHDIVVFSQDEREWGVPLQGHSATGNTNEQGTFETPTLLPGAYFVALADDLDLELGDTNDPEILSVLRTRAQRVRLGEAETATVQLRTNER